MNDGPPEGSAGGQNAGMGGEAPPPSIDFYAVAEEGVSRADVFKIAVGLRQQGLSGELDFENRS